MEQLPNESTDHQVRIVNQQTFEGWKLARQLYLVSQLERAMELGKLSQGIKDVWNTATHKKGKLLIVEEDYLVPARHGIGRDTIYPVSSLFKDPLYLREVVEDIIEKVLRDGGDVEFAEAGMLINYQYIALIE